MGKNKTMFKRALFVTAIKWEFLRRNETYIKDFTLKVPNYKKVVIVHKLSKKTKDYFFKKYNMFFVANPRYSYSDFI